MSRQRCPRLRITDDAIAVVGGLLHSTLGCGDVAHMNRGNPTRITPGHLPGFPSPSNPISSHSTLQCIPSHHNPPIHPATLPLWGMPTCRRGYATHHLPSPSTRTVLFAIRANVVALFFARSPTLTCSSPFVSVSRPCRYKGYTRPVRNGTLSRAPRAPQSSISVPSGAIIDGSGRDGLISSSSSFFLCGLRHSFEERMGGVRVPRCRDTVRCMMDESQCRTQPTGSRASRGVVEVEVCLWRVRRTDSRGTRKLSGSD